MSRYLITLLASLTIVGLTGCGLPSIFSDSTIPVILSVEDDEVLLQVEDYVLGYISHTSVWRLNMNTGNMRLLKEASTPGEWAAAGDYYVTAEYPYSDLIVSVVAGRLSTEEQVSISERDYSADGPSFVGGSFLDGERAAVGVENGVSIFDLPTLSEVRRIELPETVRQIYAFRHGRIFAAGCEDPNDGVWNGWDELYLIDSESGDVNRLPDAPRADERYPGYQDAHLTEEWLVTHQCVVVEESDTTGFGAWFGDPVVQDEILAYHIPTGDWKVLHQYESYGPDDLGTFETSIIGGDETRVLVSRRSYTPGMLRLEAIDLATGTSRLLIEKSGSSLGIGLDYVSPYLADDRLYWTDGNTGELVIYNLDTEQEERISAIQPVAE